MFFLKKGLTLWNESSKMKLFQYGNDKNKKEVRYGNQFKKIES